MKRDKFEELLQEKLAHREVTPPADLWARLETQLPAVRRELTSGDGAGSDAPDALPRPSIRRPLRRRMSWAYAAASIALVGVLIFTANNLDNMDGYVAEDTMTEEQVPQVIIPVEIPGQTTDPDVLVPGAQVQTSRIAAATQRRQTTHYTGSQPEAGPQTGITAYIETPVGSNDQEGTVSQSQEKTAATIEQQPRSGSTDSPQMDNRQQESLESWLARVNSTDRSRSRRESTPLSASLYAANTTGLAGTGTFSGRVKLQKSSLIVNETTQSPGDETASLSSSSISSGKLKHDLPLGFGASVNIGLANRLSLETGLTYTYMRSKGETINGSASYVLTQKLHYLGIPVKVKYDFFQSRFIDLYAGGGFSVEKLLSGKLTAVDSYDGVKSEPQSEKIKVGSLQTSVGANVGVEFNIDRTFGLYVEPGIGYFFENGNQPESYRTENPFNFTIKAGFRIKL